MTAPSSRRYLYMDFLRILGCFLVIVNHTNSRVFMNNPPPACTWFVSVAWYYFSKTAVPLFVMVSGACLLPRVDSYRRTMERVLRILLTLLLFSYGYYLWGLRMNWSWASALNPFALLSAIWQMRITDSFWYLYFYTGMLLMLPLFQRLVQVMKKADYHYLLGLSLLFHVAWPLLAHYVPKLTLPKFFDLPLFSVFIGLFFAGHYIQVYVAPKRWQIPICTAVIALSVAVAVGLTLLEIRRLPPNARYLFMDERTAPALPVVLSAVSLMVLSKTCFAFWEKTKRGIPPRMAQWLVTLGACSFCVYLLQDGVILATRGTIFPFLSGLMNPFIAAVLWEIGLFVVLMAAAWVLKKLPIFRKLI